MTSMPVVPDHLQLILSKIVTKLPDLILEVDRV